MGSKVHGNPSQVLRRPRLFRRRVCTHFYSSPEGEYQPRAAKRWIICFKLGLYAENSKDRSIKHKRLHTRRKDSQNFFLLVFLIHNPPSGFYSQCHKEAAGVPALTSMSQWRRKRISPPLSPFLFTYLPINLILLLVSHWLEISPMPQWTAKEPGKCSLLVGYTASLDKIRGSLAQ